MDGVREVANRFSFTTGDADRYKHSGCFRNRARGGGIAVAKKVNVDSAPIVSGISQPTTDARKMKNFPS